ncbi:hypothetical protein MMC24_005497 [Lignoscripta atroalba]|nr:hypothetical protein [Lignoscripta atroalba]
MTLHPVAFLIHILLAIKPSLVASQNQALGKEWCYVCADVVNNAPPVCNADCATAADRLCAGDRSTALEAVQGSCHLQYMPPTYPSSQPSASVDEPTCIKAFQSITLMCGRDALSAAPFDPHYCTSSGGGGTLGWNYDGTVISGSARYVMKPINADECGQHQAYSELATSSLEWNDSWARPNGLTILVQTPISETLPPAPELQTQGCIGDVCSNGNPAYFAVCEGRPTKQDARTMRHRVVFNGWTNSYGQELLAALRLRCNQDVLNWQAWNNGTAWLAEFGIYGCGCIAAAIFDASVGINVNPRSCCDELIVPAPLFNTV